MFSSGIRSFCQNHDIDLTSIDLVGAHTPSLRRTRTPEKDDWNTHPLDWNSAITNGTGITAVIDFIVIENAIPRPQLSPTAFVDKLLLRHPLKFRACLNIGELANLSFIPPLTDSDAGGTKSRDCGPGSLLIDYAVRYCTSNSHSADYNGEYASPGTINKDIVERFLCSHDYLRTPPPLIIAREMFGDHEAQRLIDECLFLNMSEADTVATITRVTAQNIVKQYHRLLSLSFPQDQKVDELFICGPSARNSHIIDFLESELPESIITRPLDDIGVPGDANEAVSYAHLALEAALGQATRPSVAASPISSPFSGEDVYGKIAYGNTWSALLAKVQKFSEGKPLKVCKDIRCAEAVKTAMKP
jgi:1,6-anhydro-N-acetylmuramate kinase